MAYAAELFVYTGRGEGAIEIPKDVVRVRIDLSVLVIPDAFALKRKLREVQLHDGIYKIDKYAFQGCTALNGLQLSDGVKSIGIQAFQFCINITKFRSPPLVVTIPRSMLNNCTRIFSVEVPDYIILVDGDAFSCCHSLRNATLASNTVVGEDATVLDDGDGVNGIRIENHAFSECSDLLYIFDTVEAIMIALRNRFNGLTLHSRIYYK
jgi:hypothetical protein